MHLAKLRNRNTEAVDPLDALALSELPFYPVVDQDQDQDPCSVPSKQLPFDPVVDQDSCRVPSRARRRNRNTEAVDPLDALALSELPFYTVKQLPFDPVVDQDTFRVPSRTHLSNRPVWSDKSHIFLPLLKLRNRNTEAVDPLDALALSELPFYPVVDRDPCSPHTLSPQNQTKIQPQTQELILRLKKKKKWPRLQPTIKGTSTAMGTIETEESWTKAINEDSMLFDDYISFMYIATEKFRGNRLLRQNLENYFRNYLTMLKLTTDIKDANGVQSDLKQLLCKLEDGNTILRYRVEESDKQLVAKLKEHHKLQEEVAKCKRNIIDEYIVDYENNKSGCGCGWLYPVAAAFSVASALYASFKRLHSSH